jgi:hypothetical protein
MRTKAQVKMFETVAVLIVFFFLLGLGLNFYAYSQRTELTNLKARQFELAAVQTAARAMAMPELDCSEAGVRTASCFDRRKLDAFIAVSQEADALADYVSVFGYANITIREVYPGGTSWTLFHQAPPARDRGGTTLVQLPVLLYEPERSANAFGVLEVRVYELA